MIRIRYQKISTNIYQSINPIPLGQTLVYITINVETNTLTIADGKKIVYKSQEKDYYNARNKARSVLKQLGAQFNNKPKIII